DQQRRVAVRGAVRLGARAARAAARARRRIGFSRRGSAVAAVRAGRRHALARLTDAPARADRAVARVLARALIAVRSRRARARARRIAAISRRVARERRGADQPAALVARGDAQPERADFSVGTREVRARIDARALVAERAVRTDDAVARAGALAAAAELAVGARHAAAQRIDAQAARRVARQLGGTAELARLRAVRDALAVLTDLAVGPGRAVVEAVAALGARLIQRLAGDGSVVAEVQALRADAFAAGGAGRAAAAALDALHAGDEVGEVAVRAAEDVLPREVELQRRDLAVVDDQVNERIGPHIVVIELTLRIIDMAFAGGGGAIYRRTAVAARALARLRVRFGAD